ncbi:cullin-2 isoform X1 [Cydia pomonella]|uniref:cullin-2 isoform X1 n=1 Tax=Cydia pomonella TaxID=82600 RepID=UPI002ADD776A|nr:cullin-2 isoform X1 [Cydia pomonella]XP_061727836.1 cullin-2 isoform X1 [Cydia pomonella]XP_061727837.1 cullin-2 isoform X1 [Cydia pomonella]
MMSLKPRNIDFQETWANLRETVAGVVGLRAVERGVWNLRFSDVYALCVAHPEPLADRLYDETRRFLEEHVEGLLERVRGTSPLENNDPYDGLLDRYVDAWREYSEGVAYLNSLYSYLNLQHVRRQKVSDAEIIYGSAATVSCPDSDSRQLEVGELGLVIWERVLVRPLSSALSSRIVAALSAARGSAPDPKHADVLRRAIHSAVDVQSFRVRAPLALYQQLVLEPYLTQAQAAHARLAADLLRAGDISHYMRDVLQGLQREVALGARFLHSSSTEAVRGCYERAAVAAHLPALHAECATLLKHATDDTRPDNAQHRTDLRRMYTLLRPLGANALRPLVDAAHAQCAKDGTELLQHKHTKDEAHTHFVSSMVSLHTKYSALFAEVFDNNQAFLGALDRACSGVVNSRPDDHSPPRAPELLARYCDALLRRRGSEAEPEARLAAAILVFKYIDDKDVFQKYYARALARRLIHQLSASMEQEEAMINRLKAACGYEFTNKLHRMFTDVAVSADLNNKFQQHLREQEQPQAGMPGFSVQVLQAGAWPLGGAMAPLAPPAALERPARQFEAFYRASFSGRRLAWLHHLCTGELRTRYTPRPYHLSASTPQCALLLCFETVDSLAAKELRARLQLTGDAWTRQLRPLLDAGLLLAQGDVENEAEGESESSAAEEGGEGRGEGVLTLNLNLSSKRTKIRLTTAATHQAAGTSAAGSSATSNPDSAEATHCDDDRKMYLQAALVRVMKQRKVLRHNELIQEVVSQARGSFAPSVAMIKKCIEALIDKQYLERAPGRLDTYSYLA